MDFKTGIYLSMFILIIGQMTIKSRLSRIESNQMSIQSSIRYQMIKKKND